MVKIFNETDLFEMLKIMHNALEDIEDMKVQIKSLKEEPKDTTHEQKFEKNVNEKVSDDAYCVMFCHPSDALKFIDDDPKMANIIISSPRFKEFELKLVDEDAFDKWLEENSDTINLVN